MGALPGLVLDLADIWWDATVWSQRSIADMRDDLQRLLVDLA